MSTFDPAVPPNAATPALAPTTGPSVAGSPAAAHVAPAPQMPPQMAPPRPSYVPPAGYSQATAGSPGVGIMWVNALLSWSLLPLVYLLFLLVRNVRWANRNGASPVKYFMPIGFVAAAFLLLIVIGHSFGSAPTTPTYP